jgi:hypothetical protein
MNMTFCFLSLILLMGVMDLPYKYNEKKPDSKIEIHVA